MTRYFDEREVARILQKATEPRKSHGVATTSSGDGLTLEEVREIAAEAGIDPARVDEAARSLSTPVPVARYSLDVFVGSPTAVQYEAELDIEIGEEERTEIVRLVRAALARQGVVGGQAGSLEWMDQDGFGGRYVTVSPTRTGTRLEVAGNFKEAAAGAAGISGVVGGLGAIGTAVAVSAAGTIGWVVVPLTLAGMIAVPRLTIGLVVRRESRKLADLVDRLKGFLASRDRSRR